MQHSDEAEEIKRIFSCEARGNCPWDIFRLDCSEEHHLVTGSELRKLYKSYALRLHPDKNKAKGAHEAFQVLSNAFETLRTALCEDNMGHRQSGLDLCNCSYRRKNTRSTAEYSGAYETKSGKRKRSTTKTTTGTTNSASSTPGPTYIPPCSKGSFRSYADLMRDLEEVDEIFKKTNAKHRRLYEKQRETRTALNVKREKERLEDAEQLFTIQQQGITERASSWGKFRRGAWGSSSDAEVAPLVSPPDGHDNRNLQVDNCEGGINSNFSNEDKVVELACSDVASHELICWVCKRQFRSSVSLNRHFKESELHKRNLLAISRTTEDCNDDRGTTSGVPSSS